MIFETVWNAIRSFTSLDEATNFLHQYYQFGNDMDLPKELHYKNCITAMLVMRFPDEILLNNQADRILRLSSQQLIEGIQSKEKLYILNLRVKTFNIILNIWKNGDKNGLLEYLSNLYLSSRNILFLLYQNLDLLSEEEQVYKNKQIQNVEDYMEKLRESISQLDITYLESFLKRKMEPTTITQEEMKQVSQHMFKTFWNKMQSSLDVGNYALAFRNLDDLIVSLRKLENIEFNLDYYKYLLHDNLFNKDTLLDIGSFLVEECNKRSNPEEKYNNVEFEKWKTSLNSEEKLTSLFVNLLKLISELVSRIEYRLFISTQKIL